MSVEKHLVYLEKALGGKAGSSWAVGGLLGLFAEERDAILACLSLLTAAVRARLVLPNDGDIGDLLTNGGQHRSLTTAQLSELADRLVDIYPEPATEHPRRRGLSGC